MNIPAKSFATVFPYVGNETPVIKSINNPPIQPGYCIPVELKEVTVRDSEGNFICVEAGICYSYTSGRQYIVYCEKDKKDTKKEELED